ncbi:MAG: NPCBM/NEW2 domain-containing protein [Fibrobacter sp.]|nr:NPCBM/NEW2 domain-containing protein [Fibrobacter sp.]
MKPYILGLLKNLAHPGTIVGLVISLAIPFLIYLGPNVGHKDTIRTLDLYLPLPLFIVQFIAGIVLFATLNKDFREWIKGILPEKKISILMLAFTAVITIFAATQIEARHRVQSDESVFMSVAQNMYYNQESGTCNQGYFENGNLKCVATSNSFKTKGLAFLYLLGMPLLGNDLHWIFHMELLMLPLAVLLMFLAVVAWTRQPLLAFFAALLTALQPTVLFQFRAMSVEPLYIFLSALSLLIFKWAYDRNTIRHWALLALSLAFFAQTRQETAFCLLAFIIFALPKLLDSKSAKAPTFFVTLSLFSVPALLTISYFQGFGFQGGEFEAHGHFLEDLSRNWTEMTKPLNKNGELENPFLSYFNYLFVAGAIYLLARAILGARKKDYFYLEILAFLLLYHIQTYMILENVSGDFSIQINQRYSLVMLPSMAFVGALPVAHLVQQTIASMSGKDSKQNAVTALLVTLVAAALFTAWTFHYKEDFNKNIMYNRNHLTIEEHEILGWLAEQPQKDRFFIYGRPWHFIGYGISSIHYDRARQMSSEELKNLVNKYQGEVYYIRGLDCWDSHTYHKKAVEHRIATTCDIFERDMDLEGVKNILITNNYWVQIAKFNGRKDFNPKNIITVNEPELIQNAAGDSAASALQYSFSLNEKATATSQWIYTVQVNGDIVSRAPYTKGNFSGNVKEEQLHPGYNQLEFVVQNPKNGKIIADIQKFYFYSKTGAVKLTEIPYASHKQGWGTLHKNESIEGHDFKVDNKFYNEGFGTHAASETVFNIEGKYKTFKMAYGLDEESLCSDGAQLQVLADGNVIFDSGSFSYGKLKNLDVNIENAKVLTLKTLSLKNIDCDHVDFINPTLIP